MIEILPNWHPIFVHFTIALFTIAVVLFLLGRFLKRGPIKTQALNVAYWNLWIGGLLTIVTLIMGWLAYNSVAHDTPSHAQMTTHRNWAYVAAGLFAVLVTWSILLKRKSGGPNIFFLLFALAAQSALGVAAYHGGEAVYRFGLGVKSLPKVEGEGHAHKHPDGKDHGDNKGLKSKRPHRSIDTPSDKLDKPAKPSGDRQNHLHSKPEVTPSKTDGHSHSDKEHTH